MSNIDKRALREAAEKATPGNWWIDSHGQAMVSFIDNEVLEVFTTDNKRDAVRHEDTGNLSRWRNDNDATFIAKANPATVLALLDELDKWQQESSAWQAVAEKQLALATSAEQKIADLESLTVQQLTQPALVSVPEVVGWEDVPEEITEDDIALASAWAIGFNQCRAAMLKLFCDSEQLDEVGSWNNHRNTPTAQDGNHTEQNLDMVDHFGDATQKAMLHGSEPETDNTNQQFESLSRGDK